MCVRACVWVGELGIVRTHVWLRVGVSVCKHVSGSLTGVRHRKSVDMRAYARCVNLHLPLLLRSLRDAPGPLEFVLLSLLLLLYALLLRLPVGGVARVWRFVRNCGSPLSLSVLL